MEPQNVSFIESDARGDYSRVGSSNNNNSQDELNSSFNSSYRNGGREDYNSSYQYSSTSRLSRREDNDDKGSFGNHRRQSTDDDGEAAERLKRMSIGSGTRTYRISDSSSSPTRPTVGTKTFRVPTKRGTPVRDDSLLPEPNSLHNGDGGGGDSTDDATANLKTEPLNEKPEKGFYISLDDEGIVIYLVFSFSFKFLTWI